LLPPILTVCSSCRCNNKPGARGQSDCAVSKLLCYALARHGSCYWPQQNIKLPHIAAELHSGHAAVPVGCAGHYNGLWPSTLFLAGTATLVVSEHVRVTFPTIATHTQHTPAVSAALGPGKRHTAHAYPTPSRQQLLLHQQPGADHKRAHSRPRDRPAGTRHTSCTTTRQQATHSLVSRMMRRRRQALRCLSLCTGSLCFAHGCSAVLSVCCAVLFAHLSGADGMVSSQYRQYHMWSVGSMRSRSRMSCIQQGTHTMEPWISCCTQHCVIISCYARA
jgi:hypothetical protein